jgi:ribose-phosphate pyrophosphokinase
MDLHAAQVQGFFKIPVDDLYALPVLCQAIEKKAFPNLVVVSPDAGFVKKARKFATRLRAPLAIADKRRTDHSEHAEILSIMGDVADRTAVLVDDFVISGGTLIQAAVALKDRGARAVYAAVTHGVLTQRSMDVFDDSPIDLLFVTNTVEPQASRLSSKLEMVSVAPLFGEAIRRIHQRESISVLFD